MARTILGADIRAGHVIKHRTHNRVYEVVTIAESGDFGDRLGTFRQSNGEVIEFNVFDDSTYELRDSMPGQRHRMVKVRAADIQILFQSPADPVELDAAVARLKAALQ